MPMPSLRRYFLVRGPLLGAVALTALLARCAEPAPPESTLEGLSQLLGRAVNGKVGTDDIAWEPGGGLFEEVFVGRPVLFLARPSDGKPRDVYRAWVRVTPAGQPLTVTRTRNLTGTPFGDDVGLAFRGGRAAFATVAYGRIQGVTVLEPAGLRAEDRPSGWSEQLKLAITNFQETGTLSGIGRTDVVLEEPTARVRLALDEQRLRIGVGADDRALSLDLATRELGTAAEKAPLARAIPQHIAPKPFVLWTVDTVRAEVGPGPIAWLEQQVFGARDRMKLATYQLSNHGKEAQLKKDVKADRLAAKVVDASKLTKASDAWPPPPIPSLWEEPKPGEGEWKPATVPFLPRPAGATDSTPPYFYQTFIRPDPKRPYSEVLLVAMDMRQLELRMQAGFEDPKPLAGPPGDGRLPREKGVTDRVVATFNGAFKTTHGSYGMMVDGRVLLPPVPGGATVVVDERGEVGLGSWPQSEAIPAGITSFRQNLDPLVEDGVINPTGRYVWGWQMAGTSVMTERTALCVTAAGQLYYAWGTEVDAPTLSQALRQAGCSYAMHLDMNPGHCGFVFSSVSKKDWDLKLIDERMSIKTDKFVRWSAKDFFYVLLKEPAKSAGQLTWSRDSGTQPNPGLIPGVLSGSVKVGELTVSLTAFEGDQTELRVRAGSLEPPASEPAPVMRELSGDDAHRVLAAVGVGHATVGSRPGLSFGPAAFHALKQGFATLVLRAGAAPQLIGNGGAAVTLGSGDEAVQLPALLLNGVPTPESRELGSVRRRSAICVAPGGRTLVATTDHAGDQPLLQVLQSLGCNDIASLDRGSRHAALLHRSGTATAPQASYDQTVLYALGRPLTPSAYRWRTAGTSPSTRPSSFDFPKVKAELAKQGKL